MKVTFQKEELERALNVIARVLPKKSALPMWQAIYMGGVPGGVQLRVTNGDQYLSLLVHGEWQAAEEGEGVALPGEEFLRLVKVAPAKTISVEVRDKDALVRSGGAEWVLRYLVGVLWSDAPDEVSGAVEGTTEADAAVLLEAIHKVQYAVSRTQNRPSFQQVLIGKQTVAADGRRAHVVRDVEIEGSYLIPEPVLEVVIDLLGMVEGPVKMSASDEGWVRMQTEKIDFMTGRLAYDFPDVLGVMIKEGAKQKGRLRVSRQALVSAVRVADTAQDEGAVLLKLVRGKKLQVEAESSQMRAKMEFDVEVENVNGSWQRSFTSDLLQEMLGAFSGESIEFRVADEHGVLYVEDEGECSALMPLHR